jgi:YbbR domain-containing protein
MSGLPSKNLAAKILCMIMAIVLWMYVMNEQNPPLEASFTIPLEVKNLASNYTLIDAPETVRVKVRGVRNVIAVISASDIAAYIDLKGVGDGRQQVKITAVVPPSVELVEVNPDKALLRIDVTTSRQLPVEVRYTGALAEGAAVGKVTLTPDTVTVDGPKSLLDLIDKVIVQVNMSNRNADFAGSYNVLILNKEDKEVEGLSVTPLQVNVAAQILATNKKTVEVKPAFNGALPAGMIIKQLTVDPPKVELSGPKALLDTVDIAATEPIVVSGDTRQFNKQIKVFTKEGLTALPDTVTVKFTVGPNL